MLNGLEIPQPHRYNGEKDPTILSGWIAAVERYFKVASVDASEEMKFRYGTLFLRDTASSFVGRYKREGREKDWSKFKTALKQEFMPANYEQYVIHRFFNIRQTRSVVQFNEEFYPLIDHLPPNFQNNEILVSKYIHALKEHVQIHVDVAEPKDIKQAMRIAEIYDGRFSGNYEGKKFRAPDYRREPMDIGALQAPAVSNGRLTPELKRKLRRENRCFLCRRKGHRVNDCPEQPKTTRVSTETRD